MRHVYIRLVLGILFAACLIVSLVTANFPFALLYLFLSGAFLLSARALWKKRR